MSKTINTFYAIDFDRCLGNLDATMALINDVVSGFSVLKGVMMAQANKEAKAKGGSFSVSRFLIENDSDLNIDRVLTDYIHKAQAAPSELLEPGALELIEYLRSNKYRHCIITFGDEKWQKTKIKAAGLHAVTTVVVEHERKSHIITSWRDKNTGLFHIPRDYCSSKIPILAKEVVLIDDKPSAFEHLEAGTRGYLVSGIELIGNIPVSVTMVNSLNDIICLEKSLKSR